MNLEAAINSIWESTQQGVYYPAQWKGKFDLEQGYRVQLGLLERYCKEGENHAGWKVGLTAKAIQEQIGFHEPVFGFLLQGANLESGAVIATQDIAAPSFETELCLVLGEALKGPGVTTAAARAAIAAVQPAFEIVERRGDFTADIPLALADNVQQKYFVTGEAVPAGEDPAALKSSRVEIFINGEQVDNCPGTNVMGDPAASVAWLANRLSEFGRTLEAGDRIMSGSFTRQFPVARGDVAEAVFQPFGKVTVEFQ